MRHLQQKLSWRRLKKKMDTVANFKQVKEKNWRFNYPKIKPNTLRALKTSAGALRFTLGYVTKT